MQGDVDAQAFSAELAELKRGGCTLLVASDAPGHGTACERLLGAPELDRSHVFLSTAVDVPTILTRHHPRRTDPGSFAVVDATSDTRSTTTTTSAAPTGPTATTEWYERAPDHLDLAAVYTTTKAAIDRVAADADGPGELRVCLDRLDTYIDATTAGTIAETELFRFLHLLCGAIRRVDGMGHVHVSASADDDVLGTIEPLFDATVEIETTAGQHARQRWHLHSSGRETGWFQL